MSAKLGIKACAKKYAEKRGCTLAEAEIAMKTVVDVITDAIVEDGGVTFVGGFSLEAVDRKERRGINPSTGEFMIIPKRRTVRLSVGKHLKDRLNS